MRRLLDAIKYAWIDRKLQKRVKEEYYLDSEFAKIDKALLTAYIFKNPYTISKNYLKKHHDREIHTYGETPLKTYETIAKECDLKETDTFLELGSGRGRGALFLHHFFHCSVIGIERIPQFVKLSKHVAQKHHLEKALFICADMLQAKIPKASVIYLYGTCLKDQEITSLVDRLKTFPKGTKIISISYPLTDYDENIFCIGKSFSVSFPWGETDAYLQTIKGDL
ncbi:MAG: methyltransferase domain-containing protein [Simkaniaceae bacterium]|nr:MAG: methyltransferase domain-containing protein [Simkaniaceae bacterium]